MSRTAFWLIFILAVAFLARIAGISYGLPMWLVSDEPPFIFGALKMLELGTLVPALHAADFASGLYFPPYLSYLYLIFFIPVLGLKYLFFNGTLRQFVDIITLDPSALFLIGRLISAVLGTATVWLVYKTTRRIFASEIPALLSAAFLALSFLHVNFSHWGRHWVPATFFFTLVLYVLSRDDMNVRRRYFLASLIAGVGVGINYQAGLSALFIALWFLIYDNMTTFRLRSGDKKRMLWDSAWIFGCALLFIALVALAYLLYPQGLVVHRENVIGGAWSIAEFFAGYVFYAQKLISTEPAFFAFIIAGFVMLFFRHKKFFWVASLFTFLYIAIFYFFFFHMDRYILMLYPLFAIVAGYGLWVVGGALFAHSHFAAYALGIIVFGISAIGVFRLDALLLKNDTRVHAIHWVMNNVPAGEKVVAFARLLRVPTTAEAVVEQRNLDPASLRSMDAALLRLPNDLRSSPRYHALNLFAASGATIKSALSYARANGYAYLIYSPEFAQKYGIASSPELLGETIATFSGFAHNDEDVTNGFGGGLRKMFALESNGPTLIIKTLNAKR